MHLVGVLNIGYVGLDFSRSDCSLFRRIGYCQSYVVSQILVISVNLLTGLSVEAGHVASHLPASIAVA